MGGAFGSTAGTTAGPWALVERETGGGSDAWGLVMRGLRQGPGLCVRAVVM